MALVLWKRTNLIIPITTAKPSIRATGSEAQDTSALAMSFMPDLNALWTLKVNGVSLCKTSPITLRLSVLKRACLLEHRVALWPPVTAAHASRNTSTIACFPLTRAMPREAFLLTFTSCHQLAPVVFPLDWNSITDDSDKKTNFW